MRLWVDSFTASPDLTLGAHIAVNRFRSLASGDAGSRHRLAASPDEADAVLFVDCHMVPHDPGLRTLRRSPLFRRFRDKSLVYDERDMPWPAWPGIYVSMPRDKLLPSFQKPWLHILPVTRIVPQRHPDLLFSFVGSQTHPIRRAITELRHPAAIVESVQDFMFWDTTSPGFEAKQRYYDQTLARSKFVLCPRGNGPSSIRLLEVLAAGRVPVIISDQWSPPEGPDWDSFSIRCPEKDVSAIPAMLEDRESDFQQLALAARLAYRDWFSPEQTFSRVGDLCAWLLERDAPARFPARRGRGRAYIRVHVEDVRWRTRGPAYRVARRLQRRRR